MKWTIRIMIICALGLGVYAWKTGRIMGRESDPVLEKVNAAIGESAAKTASEITEDGVIVHITLMTESQRYRASDIATQACTAAANALGGDQSVSVLIESPADEDGLARVYGSASYSSLTRRVSWDSHQ